MKHFVTNHERQNTIYHEFQKGHFDGKTFWKADSLCLHDDVLYTSGVEQIFRRVIRDYSDADESEINTNLWNAIMQEAQQSDSEALECLLEADTWVRDTLEEFEVFTIIGI